MKDFEIRCDESRLEKHHTLYGKFTLGPFLPGQGTTFGNALRRSLLSELSGLGITAFEILGVMQEFSTLPGLRESVLDLSLNFKQVVLTGILPYSSPPIGFLKVRGPAIVQAADLQLPAGVYCPFPEQYIATLSSNGVLNLKFLVSVGKGHSTQPYSLYRSLSKVKLQPTYISLNKATSLTKDNQNESLRFFDRSPLGEINGGDSHTRSIFDEVKQIETEKMSNVNTSLNMDSFRYSKNISQNQQQDSEILNSIDYLPIDSVDSAFKSHNKSDDTPLPYVNNVNAPTSNPSFTRPAGTIGFSPEGTANTNQGYINIQKQIFQRVNPHQVLPIDAIFTPVSQVNFLTQVNDRFETARENIVLEIWTNGSIHPKRALEEATLSLVQNFHILLKNIQHASSFNKGLRYWNYLQPPDNYDEIAKMPHERDQVGPLNGTIDKVNTFPKGTVDSHWPKANETLKGTVNTTDKVKGNKDKTLAKPIDLLTKSIGKLSLHRAVYNLDIGNLDLSLQTFILLKKAKIKTLSHLLTKLSLKEDNVVLNLALANEKVVNELNNVINQLGVNL